MSPSFGRKHPIVYTFRVLTINTNAANRVIQGATILNLKLRLKIDFHHRPAMRFFRFVKLIPTITPSSLTVVKLIEGLAKYARYARAVWIKAAKFGGNCR